MRGVFFEASNATFKKMQEFSQTHIFFLIDTQYYQMIGRFIQEAIAKYKAIDGVQ